jgi:hypothetical protein
MRDSRSGAGSQVARVSALGRVLHGRATLVRPMRSPEAKAWVGAFAVIRGRDGHRACLPRSRASARVRFRLKSGSLVMATTSSQPLKVG